jgi:tetratricopeptide (TPR) repeat protein
MNNQLIQDASAPRRAFAFWFISLFLIISTAAVYAPIRHHDFINYDDISYVKHNTHVHAGMTSDSIEWAFSVTKDDERAYWHPLTWLSHMLDCQIFGVQPGYHHLSNLLYHLINILLLFLVFTRMTGEIWKSAFVAALFALHPLNVDSVAWIAERKNLLSTTFWFFTMLAYIYYARCPSVRRYLLVLAGMTAGLLAKPMLVTLPCVLFLMDFWPLNRTKFSWQRQTADNRCPKASLSQLITEKIPLLILSAISTALSVVSLEYQNQFVTHDTIPMWLRFENAIVSCIQYISKIIWPQNMAIFYPFPNAIPLWQVLGATFLIIVIFCIVFMIARKAPFLTVGWLWFTGTLVPVIGIIQGGRWPAIADRWTYVPAIGLFIIFSWGGAALFEKISKKPAPKIIFVSLILIFLIMVSSVQIKYWENSITLFSHAIEVTKDNGLAHYNLGEALGEAGGIDQAIPHYYTALKIEPENVFAHVNLANALVQKGKPDEAVNHFNIALKLNPQEDKAYVGLGNVFAGKNNLNKAVEYTLKALEINPKNEVASDNLGKIMLQQGNVADAFLYFKKTLEIEPNNESAKTNLKQLAIIQKRIDDQAAKISETIQSNPNDPLHYIQLGRLYQSTGYYDLAIHQYEKALSIKPDMTPALYALGITFTLKGGYYQAIETFKKIIANEPDNASAYYNIACVYSRQNKKHDAIEWLQKAVDKGYDNWNNLKTDPDMDTIKDEPGYRKLMEKHGLGIQN